MELLQKPGAGLHRAVSVVDTVAVTASRSRISATPVSGYRTRWTVMGDDPRPAWTSGLEQVGRCGWSHGNSLDVVKLFSMWIRPVRPQGVDDETTRGARTRMSGYRKSPSGRNHSRNEEDDADEYEQRADQGLLHPCCCAITGGRGSRSLRFVAGLAAQAATMTRAQAGIMLRRFHGRRWATRSWAAGSAEVGRAAAPGVAAARLGPRRRARRRGPCILDGTPRRPLRTDDA